MFAVKSLGRLGHFKTPKSKSVGKIEDRREPDSHVCTKHRRDVGKRTRPGPAKGRQRAVRLLGPPKSVTNSSERIPQPEPTNRRLCLCTRENEDKGQALARLRKEVPTEDQLRWSRHPTSQGLGYRVHARVHHPVPGHVPVPHHPGTPPGTHHPVPPVLMPAGVYPKVVTSQN